MEYPERGLIETTVYHFQSTGIVGFNALHVRGLIDDSPSYAASDQPLRIRKCQPFDKVATTIVPIEVCLSAFMNGE